MTFLIKQCKAHAVSYLEKRAEYAKDICEKRWELQQDKIVIDCKERISSLNCDEKSFMSKRLGEHSETNVEPVHLCKDVIYTVETKESCYNKGGKLVPFKTQEGCIAGYVCESTVNQESQSSDSCSSAVYDPVCGSDGKTYSSDCTAKSAAIDISYRGTCIISTQEMPTSESTESGSGSSSGNLLTGGVTSSLTESTTLTLPSLDIATKCTILWQDRKVACAVTEKGCSKDAYISLCIRAESSASSSFQKQLDEKCNAEAMRRYTELKEKCIKIERNSENCKMQSWQRCEQFLAFTADCNAKLTSANIDAFVKEEVARRCNLKDYRESKEPVESMDHAGVIFGVKAGTTDGQLSELKTIITDIEKILELDTSVVYKGRMSPFDFEKLKEFDFILNAKIQSGKASATSEEIKARVTAKLSLKEIEKLRNAETVPALLKVSDDTSPEVAYTIEDEASNIVTATEDVDKILTDEDQRGFGHKLKLFFGFAKKQEKEEIANLTQSKDRLAKAIDVLQDASEDIDSDLTRAVLLEQIDNLRLQKADLEAFITAKEKRAKGFFNAFS